MTSARPDKPIRVGVVGTGFAAAAHLEALRRLPEIELAGVAGRDPARTAQLAGQHSVRAYADHLELLSDPAVDSVHTCTVNGLHHEVNLAALAHDKHVLSEKPLAADSGESATLAAAADAAAAKGVHSGVCFNYRHYPLIAQVRAMLGSGDYGPAHFVHGHYLQDWLLLESDWNWRVQESQNGGSRAMADIGSHWSDLVQHVTGEVITEVLADLGTLHPTRLREAANGAAAPGDRERVPVQSEDFGTVLLRFQSGARGAFTLSQTSAGRKNALSFQVDAAQAAFAWDQERPDYAWVGRRSGPNLELVRDPDNLLAPAARLAHLPGGHPEGWCDALRNVFADFYSGVAAERAGNEYQTDVATFRDGHARVILVESVMTSHRERRWTQVPTGTAEVTT